MWVLAGEIFGVEVGRLLVGVGDLGCHAFCFLF